MWSILVWPTSTTSHNIRRVHNLFSMKNPHQSPWSLFILLTLKMMRYTSHSSTIDNNTLHRAQHQQGAAEQPRRYCSSSSSSPIPGDEYIIILPPPEVPEDHRIDVLNKTTRCYDWRSLHQKEIRRKRPGKYNHLPMEKRELLLDNSEGLLRELDAYREKMTTKTHQVDSSRNVIRKELYVLHKMGLTGADGRAV